MCENMFFIFYSLLSLAIIYCAVSSSSNIKSDNVMETQYTNCRISSNQLIADAQATVTRILTGGCNAKIIDERFANMEKIFTTQLKEVKELIHTIIYNIDQINIYHWKNNYELYNISPRQYEIDKFNSTLHETITFNASYRLFTYYWRIENVKRKLLEWNTGYSERSNTFYIKEVGYAMFMKFTPRYFPDGTMFFSVGLTKGHRDLYLIWPFSLQLRVEILDHSPENLRVDRHSMIWNPLNVCPSYFWGRPGINGNIIDNPECVGLSMTRHLLLSNNKYLWNDNLLIKLTIYI